MFRIMKLIDASCTPREHDLAATCRTPEAVTRWLSEPRLYPVGYMVIGPDGTEWDQWEWLYSRPEAELLGAS